MWEVIAFPIYSFIYSVNVWGPLPSDTVLGTGDVPMDKTVEVPMLIPGEGER